MISEQFSRGLSRPADIILLTDPRSQRKQDTYLKNITLLFFQRLYVFSCGLSILSFVSHQRPNKSFIDIWHRPSWPTKIKHTLLLTKHLNKRLGILYHFMLDIHLSFPVSRKGQTSFGDCAVLYVRFNFLAVEILLRLVPRAKIVVHRPDLDTLLSDPGAILEERPERCCTCSKTSHDDRLLVPGR